MFRDALLRPWLVTLLCVALLLMRISGAHLHLCFDGNEAPVSVHLADQGPHHDAPGASVHHQDTDVSVIGEALRKSSPPALDLPLFLLAALLTWSLFQSASRFSPAPPASVRPIALPYLRPPLRGPPLPASP